MPSEAQFVAEKPADGTASATAAYIAEITTELAELARGSKLDILAYLLDIAQLEAATTVRREAMARRRGR